MTAPTRCPRCGGRLEHNFEWGGEPPYWCADPGCGWRPRKPDSPEAAVLLQILGKRVADVELDPQEAKVWATLRFDDGSVLEIETEGRNYHPDWLTFRLKPPEAR